MIRPDKIYLCGGLTFASATALKKCGIYSPATDTWDTSMPDMPYAVHHTASGTGALGRSAVDANALTCSAQTQSHVSMV